MNDSFSIDWAGFGKARAKANRLNKVTVFDALATAAITHVRVGFDGEGDQGQMENASAEADGKTVLFPSVTLNLRVAEFGSTELSPCELNLKEAVQHLCYGYLEERYGGWEIDDGSFGEFILDVAVRTITLDFYRRLVDTVYSNHSF